MKKSNLFWNRYQGKVDREIKKAADLLVHPPKPHKPLLHSTFPNKEHVTCVTLTKDSTPKAIYTMQELYALFESDPTTSELVQQIMTLSVKANTFEAPYPMETSQD